MFEIAGALCAVLGAAVAVYMLGHAHGRRQGLKQANDDEWCNGWDRGYDSGWEACRNKAIEYGVGAL